MLSRKKHLLNGLGVLLLLATLGASLSSFVVSRTSIQSQLADTTLPLIGDTIYSEIQRDLLKPVFVASLMANNTFVHEWVNAGEVNLPSMQRYLEIIKENYGAITAFFVSDHTRAYYYPEGILKYVKPSDQRDDWYFRVRQSSAPYEINIDPDYANKNELAVFVNYRVLNADGELLGAIGVGLSIDSLAELIQQYGNTYERNIYFVDIQGNIQLGSAAQKDIKNILHIPGLETLGKNVLNSRNGTALKYSQGNSDVFFNSRFLKELNWFLIVEEPDTQVLHSIKNTLIINLLVTLIIALLVLVLTRQILDRYYKQLEFSAHHDKLTGAYNRQFFEAVASKQFSTPGNQNKRASMMFIDIDFFKAINDQHGHAAGDQVICSVASTIQDSIRETDLVSRWGGEEFCVLLPGTRQSDAVNVSQHVLQSIRNRPIDFEGTEISVTVSIGVTERISTEPFETCLQRADEALYNAKHSGRNQVCEPVPQQNLLAGRLRAV